jgi:enolase
MSKIKSVKAYEILSSIATPTIEAVVELESGAIGEASVPYGLSAGKHEAAVLIDGDAERYRGRGVLKSIEIIDNQISKVLIGTLAEDQRKVDSLMLDMDDTTNKSKIGGNTILSVSLAVARAQANEANLPLYDYIRKAYSIKYSDYVLPNPMIVVIEGGKHADETTDLQEFIVSTFGGNTASENIRMAAELYEALKDEMKRNGLSTNVGTEGAFAPSGIPSNEMPLQLIENAAKNTKYEPYKDFGISIDAAASEFFDEKEGKYNLAVENQKLTSLELIDYYVKWLKKYPIVTIEDMLHEDDWDNWTILTAKSKYHNVVNIGDDLTVTNTIRVKKAVETKAMSGLLVKLNQIGSLTETIDTCLYARENGIMLAPSHRGGGETVDTFMVDLAVALNAEFIKVGPTRGERIVKHNRLMRIERELKGKSIVTGSNFNPFR